ncbi:MAG: glycosyltransferase [Candidatus Electrothrix sp. MAN1_4]|nr:glycosyltransferase [Candidatus Electrothrix sp. MAN1_4]
MTGCTTVPVSVIVPVYKGDENFLQCMEALAATCPQPDEILLVIDGHLEASLYPDIQQSTSILRTVYRGGPGMARNVGAKAAKNDILLFIDSDVLVPPDLPTQVMEEFKKNPGISGVFGSYDNAPQTENFLSQYRNLLHHYVHQNGKEDASTFWGACGAIKRDVFLGVGGFDEKRYPRPSIEDVELGHRLKKAGYRIRLSKDLQIKHLKQWDISSMLKTDFFQRALPWTELIMDNRNIANDLNTDISSRLSIVLLFCSILSIVISIVYPQNIFFVVAAVLGLVLCNCDVYLFFRKQKGCWFALKTIPWHWIYYCICGLGFVTGCCRYLFVRFRIKV